MTAILLLSVAAALIGVALWRSTEPKPEHRHAATITTELEAEVLRFGQARCVCGTWFRVAA